MMPGFPGIQPPESLLSTEETEFTFPDDLPGTWIADLRPVADYDGRRLFLITDRLTDEGRRVCCFWPDGPGSDPLVLFLATPGWEYHFKYCDKHSEDQMSWRLWGDRHSLESSPRIRLWPDFLVIYGPETPRISLGDRHLFDELVRKLARSR